MKNTELVLAINEPFGSVSCNFYRTGDTGDIWMTREQIGMALEYEYPRDAIRKLHARHPERLDQYSLRIPIEKGVGVNLGSTPSQDEFTNTGGEKDTYLYSNKGIMEICRWSKQPKADQFIDFVWDVMDKLIKGDLALLPTSTAATTDLIKINQQMVELQKYLTGVNEKLAAMEQEQRVIRKDAAYASYYLHSQQFSDYDEAWKKKIMPAVAKLASYLGATSNETLRLLYRELEEKHDIVLNNFINAYKAYKHFHTCSALSVISYDINLRNCFEDVLIAALKACGLDLPENEKEKSALDKRIAAAVASHAAAGGAAN